MGLFTLQGHLLAVGTHLGYIQIWDAAGSKKVSTLNGHTGRASELLLIVQCALKY